MLESILHFSIKNRWLVLLLTVMVGALGVYSLKRLPIDAVPDITGSRRTSPRGTADESAGR